jgi:hypothetical protein
MGGAQSAEPIAKNTSFLAQKALFQSPIAQKHSTNSQKAVPSNRQTHKTP